jgi:hypothetical protein
MKRAIKTRIEEVAGGSLATSAQPPRATRTLAANVSCQRTPRPIRTVRPLDTSGALRKGLRCLTARHPLPERILQGLQDQFREHRRRIQ